MEPASPPPETAGTIVEPAIVEPAIVEIVPQPSRREIRVVGPGRRERAYLERVAGLERELGACALVERGSARRLDRMERKLGAVREAALAVEQREHRLILALGALQRENEMLREKLALAAGEGGPRKLPIRSAPARRSFFARLFSRA